MLQALREQASNWIIKILLGLLIVAFAIWGINDVFLGDRDPAVAQVGKVKIPRSEADRVLRDEMNRLRPVFGRTLDRATAFRMGITQQVITRLVNRAAMRQCFVELGINVSDQMVNRSIRTNPDFRNAQGQFDRARFFRALANANISEGYYVSSLKESLATQQVSKAISGSVPVPSALLDPVTKFRSEQRTANSVLVPPGPLGRAREPDQIELQAFYKANSSRFMAPEFRDVTFIHLDPKVLAKEVNVTEEQIKQAYEERKAEFTKYARRKISQVVFKTKAQADAVSALIKAGKGLAVAAKEKDKTLKVVNLGWVEQKDLFSSLSKPVFALKKGGISSPLKSSLGWHIIKVADIEKGGTKPLSEVKDMLRNDIAIAKAIDDISKLTQQLDDILAGGAGVKAAAQQINAKADSVSIDARGRERNGKVLNSLPKGDFLRTVSQTQDGEVSSLGETGDGGFYILSVNKVTAPVLKPLNEVRSLAIISWKAEQQAKAAEKRAKAIVAHLKAGKTLAGIAKTEKLEVKTSKSFTRLTHEVESGIPAALSEKLFAAKKGEVVMAASAKGSVVGIVTEINSAVGKKKSDAEKAARQEIQTAMASDLFEQLVGACRDRVTIKTYPDLLKDRI
jgi:peptidyl-prolyl cis-trans isomerase D